MKDIYLKIRCDEDDLAKFLLTSNFSFNIYDQTSGYSMAEIWQKERFFHTMIHEGDYYRELYSNLSNLTLIDHNGGEYVLDYNEGYLEARDKTQLQKDLEGISWIEYHEFLGIGDVMDVLDLSNGAQLNRVAEKLGATVFYDAGKTYVFTHQNLKKGGNTLFYDNIKKCFFVAPYDF